VRATSSFSTTTPFRRRWLAALVNAIEKAPDDVISIGGKIVDMTGG
jgi:hypothetical protein